MKKKIIIAVACPLAAILTALCVFTFVCLGRKNGNGDYTEPTETKFVAHRGYNELYYQNTAASFTAAGKESFFWGIETDVRKTSDGVYVCCHDRTPFEDKSINIDEITYEEAKKIPLWDATEEEPMARGENVLCTYRDYLNICAAYGKGAVIELKPVFSAEDLADIKQIAYDALPADKVTFISFEKKNIDRIEKMDATVKTQLLLSGWPKFCIRAVASWGYSVSVNGDKLTEKTVRTGHKNGNAVAVWTVDDEKEAEKFLTMGVDYITTNRALRLR